MVERKTGGEYECEGMMDNLHFEPSPRLAHMAAVKLGLQCFFIKHLESGCVVSKKVYNNMNSRKIILENYSASFGFSTNHKRNTFVS
jgi:hypothetical protein